jgi:hypothetical protein
MNEYLSERAKWWPVSPELMASYRDGSHTHNFSHGELAWFKNGEQHRDGDLPAVIHGDDNVFWYKNGLHHRDGDKPAYITSTGVLEWYKNGKWHRDGDLPARIGYDNTLDWRKNGKLHRITGPAVIFPNNKHCYWINGVEITEDVNSWLKTRKYKYPFTPEQQAEFQLTFG